MNHEPAPNAPDLSATAAPRRRRAATIRDVAQAAGVSTATVSKFLNGGQRFTREVEERVAQAVRDLGYSSNPMARGMITGREAPRIRLVKCGLRTSSTTMPTLPVRPVIMPRAIGLEL